MLKGFNICDPQDRTERVLLQSMQSTQLELTETLADQPFKNTSTKSRSRLTEIS